MSALGTDRLVFDPTNPTEGSNVGAYLRDAAGNLLTSTLSGGKQALDVNIVSASGEAIYAESSASAGGDLGQSVFLIKETTLASHAGVVDGDYEWFKSNDRGALWVVPVGTVADGVADTENPVKIGHKAVSGALTAATNGNRVNGISDLYRRLYINDSPNIGAAAVAISVDNTAAVALPTTALAGRRRIMIQNQGPHPIAVGTTGVTFATGTIISNNGTMTLEVGENIPLLARSNSAAASDVRVFELA